MQAGKATVKEKRVGSRKSRVPAHRSQQWRGGALDILKSLSLSKINHALTQKEHTFNTELI